MNLSEFYPFTYSYITEHIKEVTEYFIDKRPRKGEFIGVSGLDGSFMCENAEEIYDNLQIGEKLSLIADSELKNKNPILAAMREDGTYIGILPSSSALIPNMLMAHKVNVWCYLEAKSFCNGILEIAVSVYCERY